MIFEIAFIFKYGQSWPVIDLKDSVVLNEAIIDKFTKQVTYAVDTPNNIVSFQNLNKKETDTVVECGSVVRDQTISISTIHADNILLDLNILKNSVTFTPEYHSGYLKYCKDHDIVVEDQVSTYDLYFNGAWQLNFHSPFWQWYANERSGLSRKFFNEEQINLYIGSVDTDLLEKLKKLLCTTK